MKWRDQVAVVTGGAGGIARATVRLLAQRGAAVCVTTLAHKTARARALKIPDHLVQFSPSASPTTLRSILPISSVLCASAAFMSVIVCFKVLVFEPKTTVPPITAAIAPIRTVGSSPTAPMTIARIKIPPAATATF